MVLKLSRILYLYTNISFKMPNIAVKCSRSLFLFYYITLSTAISLLCFASQGFSLYFTAVRIIKTSQEKRNFFRASHLFGVFSVVASSFLKYKKFLKFRARNFHFPKCKKFFLSGTFYFSISESFFLNT